MDAVHAENHEVAGHDDHSLDKTQQREDEVTTEEALTVGCTDQLNRRIDLQNRVKDDTAYPNSEHSIERSHGGTVGFNRVDRLGPDGNRACEELTDRLRINIQEVKNLLNVAVIRITAEDCQSVCNSCQRIS